VIRLVKYPGESCLALLIVAAPGLLAMAGASLAHEHGGDAQGAATRCVGDADIPSVHCGSTPTIVFNRSGQLWAVFEYNGVVYVNHSEDLGAHFGPALTVNEVPEDIDVNGENRPKLAFGPGNEMYVSWTRKIGGSYDGDIRFSRSLDGGRNFDAVRTINDDGLVTGHRFETLFVDRDGNVYLAWIDKRDMQDLPDAEREFAGAAVYYAVSTNRGATFARNRKVSDNSCECCRIAVAETPAGDVALLFRQIFDKHVRDHGFSIVGTEGVVMPMQRATRDDWRIDACPHHGPSMLAEGDGSYHMSWFTGDESRHGIFYARFDARTAAISQFEAISAAPTASHPSMAGEDGRLLLAWKEFDGEYTNVFVVESPDNGASWSDRRRISFTGGASDHPLLAAGNGRVLLGWQVRDIGFQVIEINNVEAVLE
jgi:hypothetical protein